ncbi:hypothetical protein [Mycolicibacterium goodii]|uniref:hypothetical protein n=1 Tax=Mycolicibacterium goodii TaxID=134601 RepID=UPI001BDD2D02|nr:hypothetical protein [Mycolicibacterium goodii]MBU8839130.1 hypothetical protein [Mycolicibacterium goodii]
MHTAADSGRETIGWCDTRDAHDGRVDHHRQPACRNFVSDAAHTALLISQAREHDRNVTHRYPNGATTREAAYVDEHRPY